MLNDAWDAQAAIGPAAGKPENQHMDHFDGSVMSIEATDRRHRRFRFILGLCI